MSQADSAYTTSRSILPAGLALQRRQFVAGGVAAVVAVSRAVAAPVLEVPDPILDAIEGHRRGFEQLRRLLAEQDAAERELRRAPRARRGVLEAQLADLCEAERLLGCAERKASLRLARAVPANLNGAAAALRYVRERYDVGRYPMYDEDGYRLLLFSTECVICATAGLAVPDRGGV